jgi:hypothetical protein
MHRRDETERGKRKRNPGIDSDLRAEKGTAAVFAVRRGGACIMIEVIGKVGVNLHNFESRVGLWE